MIEYVLCVVVDKEHKTVVLIHKLKPEFQNGKLNCPGGKVEQADYDAFFTDDNFSNYVMNPNRTSFGAVESARREFFEEAGVNSVPSTWKHVITMHSSDLNSNSDKDNWEMYICFNDTLDLSQVKTMETEKVEIFAIDALPKNIMTNLKWIIPLCLDGKFFEVIQIRER